MLIHPQKVIKDMEKRSRRRGQAALEFLMTYSWAILVVIIVIGALAYFGVLDPTNLIPQSCKLEAGFSCADYRLEGLSAGAEARISVILSNGLGRPVDVQSVVFTTVTGLTCTATVPVADQRIANGASSGQIQTANNCPVVNPGKKNRYLVLVNYVYADVANPLPQQMQGEIFARAQ
jgi:hypothetical protein